jgi:uncharacterized protein YggU (UPF0235/DUF167 family)
MDGYLETGADGVFLAVRVTPKSRRPGVGALREGAALCVAVNAAPENSKANDATVELLAGFFGIPKRSFALTHGATSRAKRFWIAGDPAALRRTIESKLA